MSAREVEVTVYDKAFNRVGWIGDPLVLTATPRHNQQPTASITLAGNNSKIALLAEPGARCVIRYRDEHMVGGMVRLQTAEGVGGNRRLTFQVSDDWRLLSRVLLWPVPGSAITSQGGSEYHTVTGPAETVVKTLLGAAITRLGLPVTVAPDLGRGDTITVKARMDKPVDVLYPLVDQAGIGVTVRQVGSGLVLDCYEPTTWPINLSVSGGTIVDGSWSYRAPEVTRVVGGFDGDGTARNFRAQADSAVEGEWGDLVEDFVDARDLKVADAGFTAAANARMQAHIAANRAAAGLSLSLAETSIFRYGGSGVHVGDILTAELAPGVTTTDVLREATLTLSKDGTQITPVVGERRDDPDYTLGRAVAALASKLRKTTRS